jgi:hypothetical protein
MSLLESRIQRPGSSSKTPHEVFAGISDKFWFWLCTTGRRRAPSLAEFLPDMLAEDVQLTFTGNTSDAVMLEGFAAYRLFKILCESYIGPLARCENVLDFGCGWGRIIRFFLKDLDSTHLWGADPVTEMIEFCKQTNPWSNFSVIDRSPPSRFPTDTFDMIYSFSVFFPLVRTDAAKLASRTPPHFGARRHLNRHNA